jgi:hypothetical protein
MASISVNDSAESVIKTLVSRSMFPDFGSDARQTLRDTLRASEGFYSGKTLHQLCGSDGRIALARAMEAVNGLSNVMRITLESHIINLVDASVSAPLVNITNGPAGVTTGCLENQLCTLPRK